MAADAVCGDCAIGYDVWPESGCPNCGCGEPAPAAEAPPTVTDVEPAPDYASWTVAELRDELEYRGLSTSGVKAVLVARLEGDDG